MGESSPYLSSFLAWTIPAAFFVAVTLFFSFRRNAGDPKMKFQDDRALLKELLEGFGLEVPNELKNNNSTVIKSIKSP